MPSPVTPTRRRKLSQQFVGSLAALVTCIKCIAADPLDYQPRANRSEGLGEPHATTPGTVTLLSAKFDLPVLDAFDEDVTIEFFLPTEATPTAIEAVDTAGLGYRLDKVTPNSPWMRNSINLFHWSGVDVLLPLQARYSLKPSEVGLIVVLSRLGVAETVAPAIIYSTRPLNEPSGYIFAFEVDAKSVISIRVTSDSNPTNVVYEEKGREVLAGVPFSVHWSANPRSNPGNYHLQISGKVKESLDPIEKDVYFLHR